MPAALVQRRPKWNVDLLEASQDGTITAEQVTAAGLHRSILQKLVENGELYRFGRGLYVRTGCWEDDIYLLQRKYGRGIYSHDTALYLHGYSDRTPAQYTINSKFGNFAFINNHLSLRKTGTSQGKLTKLPH